MTRTEKVQQCAALIKKGRYKDSFDACDFAIAESPNDSEAWRTKGEFLWALREYGSALVCHIIAEQVSQREIVSEDMRSRFLKTSTDMTRDIVERFNKDPGQFKDIDLPTDKEADRDAQRLRYIDFLNVILTRLDKDPKDAKALYQEGLVLMLLHRYREALTALDLLRKIEPRNEDALLKTLQILSELGEQERAYATAKAYLELRPEDPVGWELLGDVCVKLHLNDEAIAAFDRSLKMDPTNVMALFLKGIVLGRMG
jgi:tetratricopeptide (TPR) repeat protein